MSGKETELVDLNTNLSKEDEDIVDSIISELNDGSEESPFYTITNTLPKVVGTEQNPVNIYLAEGTYFIKVYNNNNQGHYSLAIGEAEFFGSNLWEQILTWTPIILYIGPFMDIVHWQKFDIRAYIHHIALLVLITIIYFLIKRRNISVLSIM